MIKVGDSLPAVTLSEYSEVEGNGCSLGPNPVDVAQATAGKTIAIFGLPGAFTPTCSAKHVPSYLDNHDALKAAGVDEIWCVSVNDAFVMGAWARDQKTDGKVRMIADGDAAFAKARAAIGQERILVNCAGTADAVKTVSRDKKTGEIRPCPTDRFNRIIQINLVGTFRCIAKSAAGMLTLAPLADGDRGAIVNTASAAAQDGQVGQASYAASKAAIVGMALPIARDMMDEGIRVNTIMPGIFGTPLLLGLPDNVKQALAASVPFPKRLGDPDEFAQAVEFLVTCGYMNAESIRVDGAIRMAPR